MYWLLPKPLYSSLRKTLHFKLPTTSFHLEIFLKGLGASQMLLEKAVEGNAFFEAVVLLKNQIDGLLRFSVVLKLQTVSVISEMEMQWIIQKRGVPNKTFSDVEEKATQLDILTPEIKTELRSCLVEFDFLVNNFITSSVVLPDIERFAARLYKLMKALQSIVYGLESEQIEKGVGMARNTDEADLKLRGEDFKSKIGKETYFPG